MPVPVTSRVIDGADRGLTFEDLETPITIGREEGNTIQLNDERISRYHIKIQEDHDRLVLTDLESTNGTKVNGEDMRLRILRFGDMISIGRSMLLYGSREEIAGRLSRLRAGDGPNGTVDPEALGKPPERIASLDFELNWQDNDELQATLYSLEPPELPERLSPGQRAQLSELLEYLHLRIRSLLQQVSVDGKAERISLDMRQWQNMLDLQARLSEYLRHVAEPDAE